MAGTGRNNNMILQAPSQSYAPCGRQGQWRNTGCRKAAAASALHHNCKETVHTALPGVQDTAGKRKINKLDLTGSSHTLSKQSEMVRNWKQEASGQALEETEGSFWGIKENGFLVFKANNFTKKWAEKEKHACKDMVGKRKMSYKLPNACYTKLNYFK